MSMKRLPVLGFLITSAIGALAQHGYVARAISDQREQGVQFNTRHLFQPVERSLANDQRWNQACSNAEVIVLDVAATAALLNDRPQHFALALPSEEGTLILDLQRVTITTDDFAVIAASSGTPANVEQGVHYRGAIRGVEGSLPPWIVPVERLSGCDPWNNSCSARTSRWGAECWPMPPSVGMKTPKQDRRCSCPSQVRRPS